MKLIEPWVETKVGRIIARVVFYTCLLVVAYFILRVFIP